MGQDDQRGAIAPIGTILLVGVVVVGGMTLGVLALSLGEDLASPSIGTVEIQTSQQANGLESDANVTITYTHGDTLERDKVTILLDGRPAESVTGVAVVGATGRLSSGNQIRLVQTSASGLVGGESVVVQYAPDPDTSQLIERSTVPAGGSALVGVAGVLSFENADDGDTTPPDPWQVQSRESGTTIEMRNTRATDGNISAFLSGGRGGPRGYTLYTAEISTEVNLTGVETIRFDAYPTKTDTIAGEIDLRIGSGGNRSGITGLATNTWHRDRELAVGGYTGVHDLVFHARGSNAGYIDRIRFYDAEGDPVPLSAVLAR